MWYRAPFAEDTHRCNRGLIEKGSSLDRAGHPDTAVAPFERALAIRTMDGIHYEATWYPPVLGRLGALHESLGNQEQAIHYYPQSMDLREDADADLQLQVTDARMALGQLMQGR